MDGPGTIDVRIELVEDNWFVAFLDAESKERCFDISIVGVGGSSRGHLI